MGRVFSFLFLPENSFVLVLIWAWTSMPITASQPSLMNPLVDVDVDVVRNLKPWFLETVSLENMVNVQNKNIFTWLFFTWMPGPGMGKTADLHIHQPLGAKLTKWKVSFKRMHSTPYSIIIFISFAKRDFTNDCIFRNLAW